MLRKRLKELEAKALEAINENQALQKEAQNRSAVSTSKVVVEDEEKVDAKEVEELAEAFKAVKTQMASELELNAKTQKEMETDLSTTKHSLLEIQHQLNMAEKVSLKLIENIFKEKDNN